MRNNMAFIVGVVKLVRKFEFKNTIVLSGVLSYTSRGLEFSYFYTQYFKLSEIEKAYLQHSMYRPNNKPMENLMKIQKLAKSILPLPLQSAWGRVTNP